MNNATPHANAYRPDIDGLRAVAVILVIIYHAFPEMLQGGFVGVDVFFVISGFLIGGIILRDLAAENFSFLHFYARRVLRIFPALLLVLGAVLAAGYFLLFRDEYETLGKHVFGGTAFVANFMYYAESGYFGVNAYLKPLLHLWSLGVEEQFYFVIPVALAAAWKLKLRLAPVLLFLLLASFACNLHYYKSHQELDFYMPFTRFWEIFMGVLLAALTERENRPQSGNSCFKALWAAVSKDDWRYARFALSILGLACLIVGVLASRSRHYPGHRALWTTFGTMFLIAAGPQTWLNRRVLSNKLAVGIGLISYPLYLWHWPFLSFAVILNGELSGSWRWLCIRLVCVLLSFVLAFLTYALVERPLRFGKTGRKAKIAALAVLMACAGCIGASLFLLGAPERSFMESYQANLDAMRIKSGNAVPNPRKDDSVLSYIPGAEKLAYARYENVGGKRTVALLGDSHTLPVFQGMLELNRPLGLNMVLLQCSPGFFDEFFLSAVKGKEDITDVFLIMRGVYYFAGEKDLDASAEMAVENAARLGANFKPWLQKLIDELLEGGKRVYILSENPVFPALPRIPLDRPFALSEFRPPVMKREDVYNHQKAYLDMLSTLQGATIINGMDVLCPDGECPLYLDGIHLYGDDDHLSAYGGRYLVENLLATFPR